MYDKAVVERLQPCCNVSDDLPSVTFRQRLDWLLHQVVQKVACRHELCHDVQVLRILECLDELQNVGAASLATLLNDLELGEGLSISRKNPVNGLLGHQLDGYFDQRIFVVGQDYRTKGAFSKFTQSFVLVDAAVFETLKTEDFLAPHIGKGLVLKEYGALLGWGAD
jgi:hypothetical protein